MNVNVLTDAPGGYVEIEAARIVKAQPWRSTEAVSISFDNGDFVVVSGEVARGLEQLGLIPAKSLP